MEHFQYIYKYRAVEYHRMITAEDVDGNLLATLSNLVSFQGKRVLDLGTGTGRIPLLLNGMATHVIGLDNSQAMLHQSQTQRTQVSGSWGLIRGDMRRLPIISGWADITCAGWTIGHLQSWFGTEWRTQIGHALREMQRVTGPGGCLVILETLGTGCLKPTPDKILAEYYRWLEHDWGFSNQVISTDY
jgi:ubiquinone/menaquinone biosynthesis C-methylase UbiE